jgi:hypothetical protein
MVSENLKTNRSHNEKEIINLMNFAPKLHTKKLKHLCSSEGEKQCCFKRRFEITIEGDHWGRKREERREGVRKSNRWKVEEERSLRESW